MKGLLMFVLRPADMPDCTNGGVTSRVTQVVLIGAGVPELFEPTERSPALRLVLRTINGKDGPYEYQHAEPVERGEGVGPMFGGNYIETSDSRKPGRYPIPVHDRFETAEQNERNSI